MNSKNKDQAINFNTVKHVMVTDFENYWEPMANRGKEASFMKNMTEPLVYRLNLPKEPVTTLFIEKKENRVIRSWVGKSSEFRWESKDSAKRIRFKVSQLEIVSLPPEFKKYMIGWHINKSHAFAKEHLRPVFLEEMERTDEWALFELYCHYLFKLIGISNMHSFPTRRNKGKADGEFILKDMYVLYDATLNGIFRESKEEQIERYISKMRRKRTVTIGKQQYPLKGKQKQIWIITRGEEIAPIPTQSNTSITVKEIPFHKLESLYYKRLHEELSEESLYHLLKDL